MRAAAPLAVLVAALVASTAALGAGSSTTSLRVTYWEDGAVTSKSVTWTLRCDPASGSLARPARACTRLAAGGVKLFAPLRKDMVCTELYGGPQRARVVGTVDGKRVWATFTRRDGCEIDRWQRISPWLVPPGGVT
jgi:Subtilisin inhibitor-like